MDVAVRSARTACEPEHRFAPLGVVLEHDRDLLFVVVVIFVLASFRLVFSLSLAHS